MRLKALGAVAALTLTAIAFASVVVTRIQTRGYALDSSNTRFDFQLNAMRRQQGSANRYFGLGSFAWTSNGRTQGMRIRSISSITVDEDSESRVVRVEGKGQLGRWGFTPERFNGNLTVGDFIVTFTDNFEGDDTVSFSFTSGAGVNGTHYSFSGNVQSGVLNVSQWTL